MKMIRIIWNCLELLTHWGHLSQTRKHTCYTQSCGNYLLV